MQVMSSVCIGLLNNLWKIHVDKESTTETTTAARKLMHRFKEEEVQKLIDEVERA